MYHGTGTGAGTGAGADTVRLFHHPSVLKAKLHAKLTEADRDQTSIQSSESRVFPLLQLRVYCSRTLQACTSLLRVTNVT